MSARAKRADWRLLDYAGRIRAEVRGVEAAAAATTFRTLVGEVFGTGAGIPHPTVSVRRRGEQWTKLNADQRARFWRKSEPEPAAEPASIALRRLGR